jgi:hypothetical protein
MLEIIGIVLFVKGLGQERFWWRGARHQKRPNQSVDSYKTKPSMFLPKNWV